jgi:hypothetical protein
VESLRATIETCGSRHDILQAGQVEAARGLGRQFLASRKDLPVGRQCVFPLADLTCQLGHFVIRLPQGPPRSQVRLLAKQRTELAVEIAGRLQEPVADVLELLLLQQEVFADARVKRLDRLDSQVVPGLDD